MYPRTSAPPAELASTPAGGVRVVPRSKRRSYLLRTALADSLALALAVLFASRLLFDTPWPWLAPRVGYRVLPFLAFLLASSLLISALTTSLERNVVARPSYLRAGVILGGTLVLTAVLVVLSFSYVSRPLFGLTLLLWAALAVVHRAWQRHQPWAEPMVIVSDEHGLIATLGASPHTAVLSVIEPDSEEDLTLPAPGTTLVVDLRAVLSPRVAQFVSSCAIAGFVVRPLTAVYEDHTGRVPLVALGSGWEISAPLSRHHPYLPFKRILDVAAVVATLPFWLLPLLAVAAIVRLSSPGPVIFRQERVGLRGKPFTLLKFRTMHADAEKDGPQFTRHQDPRLTRAGRLLRRTHLDELPQFFNVLRGDLSLVGPRPEQTAFVEQFRQAIPFYTERHLVRPGVTGWAQVRYGYADDQAETIEKLSFDLYYIRHMSPLLDLRILGQSLVAMFSGRGAR